MSDDLLTPAELYAWLKISRATAWKWRQKGMPYIGKSKGIRYSKSEVETWMRNQSELSHHPSSN